ncbi:hypothetical protein Q7C36_023117 [Tachysurus vachellii]|uniref:C-type lectin domain-containing protein n=1 Tax=Tachysurus vachellii TaxID=175792 RepID=A0AA88ILS3_TACVA|nr:hypothetical protein Q7C36_023117 [Tachysurus vachellii]
MRAEATAFGILYGFTVLASCRGTRVVSGQTVCHGGTEKPCYKIAYFSDVSSRVAFWEAQQVCEVDGGSLLSVENITEQQHIEQLLQNLSRTSSGSGIADGDFWIGLTRVNPGSPEDMPASLPVQICTDGRMVAKWYTDEPSCGGEACVVMYHQPTAQAGLGGRYLYHHLVKEHGDRPASRDTDNEEVMKTPDVYEDKSLDVTVAGDSSMLLIYVIIPTIPLLLLILVASGTCCFQMLSRKPRTKTSVNQSTLWISKTPKSDSAMEV